MSVLAGFFIPCVPPKATSQQKGAFAIPGGGGIRFFKKAHVKQAENSLLTLLLPHKPQEPFLGPLRLSVAFLWPWRKDTPKKVIAAVAALPMASRPDCSNIVKMLEDSMTTLGFWMDDGQIADLSVRKFYSLTTGIAITIAEAPPLSVLDLVALTGGRSPIAAEQLTLTAPAVPS